MLKQILKFTAIFILLTHCLNAQDTQNLAKNAWSKFVENKYDEAAKESGKFLQSAPNDLTALAMDIEFNIASENYAQAVNSFIKLVNTAEDPNPYIDYFWIVWGYKSDNHEELEKDNEKLSLLLENPKLDVTSKATLLIELAKRYDLLKEVTKARETYAQIKSISNWSLLGPFDNIVGRGFDNEKVVVDNPKEFKFTGRYGSKIGWYVYRRNYPCNWVYLDNYNASSNSIVFAQSFVKSDKSQECYLDVGFSGSIKVFVNDVIVFKEQKEKNNGNDSYRTKIKLNAGYNRILVQVGQSVNNSSNFLIRLKDFKDNILEGITSLAEYQDYTKSNETPKEEVKTFRYDGFVAKLKSNTIAPDFYEYLVIKYLNLTENFNDCIYRAEALSEKYPKSINIMNLQSDYYYRVGNFTMYNEIVKKSQELDTNSIQYFLYLYNQEAQKEDYAKCMKIVEQFKDRLKEETYYFKLTELYAQEKQYDKLIEIINTASEKYPFNRYFLTVKSYIDLELIKDYKKVIKNLSKITDYTSSVDLFKLKCDIMLKSNKYDDLIEYIESEEPFYFDQADFFLYIASIYKSKQEYTKAEEYLQKVLDFSPYYSIVNENIGELYESSDPIKAKKYYKRSLESYPYDYDNIRKMRDLNSLPSIFSLFEENDFYKLLKEHQDVKDGNDDLNYIVDEENVVIYQSGAAEIKYSVLIKILNEQGIDNVKEYSISSYSNERVNIEKAEVIKPNGSKIPAEINDEDIVFPNLQVGDGVLVIYKVKYFSLPGLDNQFFHHKIFQNTSFTKVAKLNLLVDTNYVFNHVNTGNKLAMTTKDIESFKYYSWEKKDIPQYDFEDYTPSVYDITDIIYLSSKSNWADINKWYKEMSNINTEEDVLIDRKIKEIFPNGHSKISELDRAKEVYKYIVQNIRYSSVSFRNSGLIPQKPTEVLATKLGDCKDVALLFKTLCDKVEVKSNLILVSTRDNGMKQFEKPNINFNHCMALLKIDGKKYFIELTSDMNGFNVIGSGQIGSAYFEIGDNSDEKISYIQSDIKAPNKISKKTKIDFKENLMTVTKDYVLKGDEAVSVRYGLKNKTKKEEEEFFTNYLPGIYPTSDLINYKYGDLTNVLSDSITYDYTYHIENPYNVIGEMELIRIPFSQNKEDLSFVSQKNRIYPFCIWQSMFSYESDIEEVEINYPVGKTIMQTPKDLIIDNELFLYKMEYKFSNNSCKVLRTTKVKKDQINAEEFAILTKSVKQMIEAEKVQLAFVPAPTKGTKKAKK